jgi:hypothetical protein
MHLAPFLLLYLIPTYGSWREVAGYFDGDGCVGFAVGSYVLRFPLSWADNSVGQLAQLRNFLISRKIRVGTITNSEAQRLEIGAQDAILQAADQMIKYSGKKSYELSIARDYLLNRINGTEAVERLNQAIIAGEREGKIRHVNLPWTRIEGKSLQHRIAVEKSVQVNTTLTSAMIEGIISEYRPYKMSQARLAVKYGTSRSSVARVLKAKR